MIQDNWYIIFDGDAGGCLEKEQSRTFHFILSKKTASSDTSNPNTGSITLGRTAAFDFFSFFNLVQAAGRVNRVLYLRFNYHSYRPSDREASHILQALTQSMLYILFIMSQYENTGLSFLKHAWLSHEVSVECRHRRGHKGSSTKSMKRHEGTRNDR